LNEKGIEVSTNDRAKQSHGFCFSTSHLPSIVSIFRTIFACVAEEKAVADLVAAKESVST